jgi:hypothetical protein
MLTTPCLDCAGEFSKDRREPMPWIGVPAEFVVSAVQVLDECGAGADHSGRAKPFEATHGSEPGLEPNVIGFDGIAYYSVTWQAVSPSSSSTRG